MLISTKCPLHVDVVGSSKLDQNVYTVWYTYKYGLAHSRASQLGSIRASTVIDDRKFGALACSRPCP
jgi:hypothetical protein